jgi:hypothetical protein
MSASPGFVWGEGPMRGVNIGGWSVIASRLSRWCGGPFRLRKDLFVNLCMWRGTDIPYGIDGDYRDFAKKYMYLWPSS